MNSIEFQAALRQEIRTKLPAHVAFARQAMKDDVDHGQPNLLLDPGGVLAKYDLMSSDRGTQISKLVLALYNNTELDEYLSSKIQKAIKERPEIFEILSRLFRAPAKVPDADFNSAMTAIIEDERFLFGYLRHALADRAIRSALGLPDDFDVEKKIGQLQRHIRAANNWEELIATKPQADFFGSFACGPEACAAALLVWAVILVVQTIGVVQAYAVAAVIADATAVTVTVVSADGIVAELPKYLKEHEGKIGAVVVNRLPYTVWVTVTGPAGRKRLPIPAGKSSLDCGISSTEAVLIGGSSNPLKSLSLASMKVHEGIYRLCECTADPAIITLTAEDKGPVLNSNAAQLAGESLPGFGFISSQVQSEILGTGRPIGMSTVAAGMPDGFNYQNLVRESGAIERFYRSLRCAHYLKTSTRVFA